MVRALFVTLLLGVASSALAYTSPGSPTGYINDFAGVLNEADQNALEMHLKAYTASTSNEVAVAIVPNLGGDYIENYAVKLFEEWGIGTRLQDNGILIVLAVEERELRIEVGYGLEGALPDSVADRIIRNEMVPALREGNYRDALFNGVNAIMQATAGEYTATSGFPEFSFDSVMPFLFGGFIVLQWIFAILARTKSWWLGGVFGLIAGVALSTFIGLWMLWGVLATIGLTLLGLLFDFLVSSAYRSSMASGRTPPWWSGGSGSGWGGGRSGGGGFGGFGGGRSGGGGASGRW